MDPDYNPETLQNKVQWDLRFYFARRANENIDKFTKGTFTIRRHEDSGLRYIVKCYDERTKNHQMDLADIQTACMVEVPESAYCPLTSFMKYTSHLSPLINDFWQYPKEKDTWRNSDVWYTNKKIGPNPLSTFMSKLSNDADLSQIYTNHSIRVTSATYLSRKQFSAKQIMSVTGHKSLNSLAIYQKVSTDEKLSMAYAMSCYLQHDKCATLPIPAVSQALQVMPIQNPTTNQDQQLVAANSDMQQNKNKDNNTTNNEKQIVCYEPEDPFGLDDNMITDFDLGQIMETIEKENTLSMTQAVGSTTTTMQKREFVQKRSPQVPIFNNCKIGTINITINKN